MHNWLRLWLLFVILLHFLALYKGREGLYSLAMTLQPKRRNLMKVRVIKFCWDSDRPTSDLKMSYLCVDNNFHITMLECVLENEETLEREHEIIGFQDIGRCNCPDNDRPLTLAFSKDEIELLVRYLASTILRFL